MTLSDVVISAIIKKGIFYESRNVNIEGDIPIVIEGKERKINFSLKADHMSLKLTSKEEANNESH